MTKGTVAVLSVCLGVGAWLCAGSEPLEAGGRYMFAVGLAGFLVGFAERDVSWTAVTGLYIGQLLGLFGVELVFLARGLPGAATPPANPLAWKPLFVLSFSLAAVLGTIFGTLVARVFRKAKAPSIASER